MKTHVSFEALAQLLGKRAADPSVSGLLGERGANIKRYGHTGSTSFKQLGFELGLEEAAFVVPDVDKKRRRELHVSNFHFHRREHEGFAEYPEKLPGGVVFNDSKAEIIAKLGIPIEEGGGSYSELLEKPYPYWIKHHYAEGRATLHFQFEDEGRLEMVTLSLPKS
jgi:hypothetical protein